MNELENLRQDAQRDRERNAETAKSLDLLAKIVENQGRTTDRILEMMQGNPAWKQRGMIDQITEMADFMKEMRGFNFSEMKTFVEEYHDFKKRIVWLAGGVFSLATVTGLILTNLEKIEKLFTHHP